MRRWALGFLAAAVLMAVPAAASAKSSGQSRSPKLDLTVSAPDPITGLPTASAAWVGNPNTGNPVLVVSTGPNPALDGAYSYFDGVVTNTPVNGETIGDVNGVPGVNNIAFDYKGPLGAGAPRISLGLSDGSYVYLSAGYSSKAIGGGWYQFNTDDRDGSQVNQLGGGPAIIWDSLGNAFTFSGGFDPWVNMVLAHGPSTTITSIDVVQDENHGTVAFDNLRFDTVVFVQGGVKNFITVPPVS